MFTEVLCDFDIDLITVSAGVIIAVAIVEQLNSAFYVWLGFALLALGIPFRLWKYTVENKE